MASVYSFDVAFVPARLSVNGRRDLSRPTWVRAVVAADGVVSAHLTAAQLVGVHGCVIEVLLRE
jgi:hypothetical protein